MLDRSGLRTVAGAGVLCLPPATGTPPGGLSSATEPLVRVVGGVPAAAPALGGELAAVDARGVGIRLGLTSTAPPPPLWAVVPPAHRRGLTPAACARAPR
eukprot:4627274-Prymnesium_polylepis.1